MSDDLIRRSDAIKAVNPSFMSGLAKKIEAIPSVEPKRGEWIESDFEEIKCSVCGSAWDYCDNDCERFNFCPNCGADMRGADDE